VITDLDFLIIKEVVPEYGIDRMRELDEIIDRNIAADMLVYRPDEFEKRIELGDPFNELPRSLLRGNSLLKPDIQMLNELFVKNALPNLQVVRCNSLRRFSNG